MFEFRFRVIGLTGPGLTQSHRLVETRFRCLSPTLSLRLVETRFRFINPSPSLENLLLDMLGVIPRAHARYLAHPKLLFPMRTRTVNNGPKCYHHHHRHHHHHRRLWTQANASKSASLLPGSYQVRPHLIPMTEPMWPSAKQTVSP